MPLIRKSEEYIRDKIEEYENRDEPGKKPFHSGLIDGYKFVLDDDIGDVEVLDELERVDKKVSKRYDRLMALDWLPVINRYYLKKAHYYDGYRGALLDASECFVDNTGGEAVLRRRETEEEIAVIN